jgi:hypothetical protein
VSGGGELPATHPAARPVTRRPNNQLACGGRPRRTFAAPMPPCLGRLGRVGLDIVAGWARAMRHRRPALVDGDVSRLAAVARGAIRREVAPVGASRRRAVRRAGSRPARETFCRRQASDPVGRSLRPSMGTVTPPLLPQAGALWGVRPSDCRAGARDR